MATRTVAQTAIVYSADATVLLRVNEQVKRALGDQASDFQKQSAKIRAEYLSQIDAAKKAGAAEAELAAIRQRYSAQSTSLRDRAMSAVASQNSLRGFESYASGAEQAAESMRHLGDAHAHAVPGMAAASANLRALEGNFTHNIRAGERFLTMLPGMESLLQKSFPVIGAAVLGVAMFELGKKAYDAVQNVVLLKEALKQINELEITVAKKLDSDADAVEKSIEAILEKTSGKSASLRQKYSYDSSKPLDMSDYFYDEKFKKLPDNVKADYEKLYKNIAPGDIPERLKKITGEVANLQGALKTVTSGELGPFVPKVGGFGPGAVQDPASYYQTRLKAAQQIAALLRSESDKRAAGLQQVQIEVPEAESEEAKKKAQAAAEASRKAQEEIIRQTRAAYLQWKVDGDRDLRDEADWWARRLATMRAGSTSYAEALREYNDSVMRVKQDTRTKEKENASVLQEIMRDEARERMREQDRGLDDAGRRTREWVEAVQRNGRQRADAELAAQEAQVKAMQSSGKMSRLQAAMSLDELREKAYRERRSQLAGSLSNAANVYGANSAEAVNAKSALDGLDENRAAERIRTAAEEASYTWSGAMRRSLAVWVQDAGESAQQVANLTVGAINSANQQLSSLMVGRATNVSEMLRGVAQQGAMVGLGQIESGVLGMFSKPDGTTARPLAVRIVGSTVDIAGGMAAAGEMGGGWLNGIMGAVFGSFRADGGPVTAGMTYMVGERGPELLTMGGSGHITPNDALRGNSVWSPTVHVDARGSSDPAAVEAAAHRAVMAAVPHIVGATMSATRDARLRQPSSTR